MIILFQLVILLIALLILIGMLQLTRKLIPEFDIWWKQINKRDSELSQIEILKDLDHKIKQKEKLVSGIEPRAEYKKRLNTIKGKLKERGFE